MRAAVQRSYGGPERLTIAEVARPEPGPTEVLVEVRAAGLSPGDRALLSGVPYVNRLAASGLRRPKHPIPGFDCAGVVHAVGDDVTRFQVGDHVFGSAPGSFAELAVAAEGELVTMPAGWSFADAASIPESGCVALQAVHDRGHVEAGQHVAVVGASGGVGSLAVQIAKAAGAHVTGTCSTRMVDAVRALGVDDVVDRTTDELVHTGRRYDVVIDTAGRTPLRDLRRVLTRQGTLVLVGADHRRRVTGGLGRWLRALLWSPTVPQHLRPFVAAPLDREQLDRLVDLMEHDHLHACVDRTFPLADAADAMRHLDHRDRPGKVVVTVDPT